MICCHIFVKPDLRMPTKWILLLIALSSVIALFLYSYPDTFYRPVPNGICNGKLPDKPNWVSSLVDKRDPHYIEKLPLTSSKKQEDCLKKINSSLVIVLEGVDIVGYRRTRVFGFTDWFCLRSATGEITSSATLGYYDFGVNRAFVSKLRACLQ